MHIYRHNDVSYRWQKTGTQPVVAVAAACSFCEGAPSSCNFDRQHRRSAVDERPRHLADTGTWTSRSQVVVSVQSVSCGVIIILFSHLPFPLAPILQPHFPLLSFLQRRAERRPYHPKGASLSKGLCLGRYDSKQKSFTGYIAVWCKNKATAT